MWFGTRDLDPLRLIGLVDALGDLTMRLRACDGLVDLDGDRCRDFRWLRGLRNQITDVCRPNAATVFVDWFAAVVGTDPDYPWWLAASW
jgi:hypothetical protein